MGHDDLTARVRRIYAAISASVEADVNKFLATVIDRQNFTSIYQDFSGGLREEEISNLAHMALSNIASLRDHLIKWAGANGKDPQRVWDTFHDSIPLRIVQDLFNNDKHGYPPKDGRGNSGVAPMLAEVNRVMRLKTKPRAGSGVMLTLGPGGRPVVSGDGTASVVVTGQVVDKDGKVLGDLYDIELKAVEAWENLLTEYGVQLPTRR